MFNNNDELILFITHNEKVNIPSEQAIEWNNLIDSNDKDNDKSRKGDGEEEEEEEKTQHCTVSVFRPFDIIIIIFIRSSFFVKFVFLFAIYLFKYLGLIVYGLSSVSVCVCVCYLVAFFIHFIHFDTGTTHCCLDGNLSLHA